LNIGLTTFVTLALVMLSVAAAVRAAAPTVTAVSPSNGIDLGGQTVTVSGANFNTPAALNVSFGGTPATAFSVISDTKISATTPFHAAGSVSVVVTNADGSNAANALYTFNTDNRVIQVVAKVTLPKRAEIEWGNGTSIDDAGTDHTAGANRISPYVWTVKDAISGTNLDCNSTYTSNDATNAKSIFLSNVSRSNSEVTVTAVAVPSVQWTLGAAPGVNQLQVSAKLGAGAFVTLAGTPATLHSTFARGTLQPLVLEVKSPTQIAAASVGAQQQVLVTFTATAN
jgi:hypothetical protein